MASQRFRKKLIVDSMQLKILGIVICYIMVAILLSALIMFLPSFLQISSREITPSQYAAAREILVLHKRFWPAILIVTALLALHAIYLFHRIFGPLYRFRQMFSEIAAGNLLVPTTIRKNDLLHREEEQLAEMVAALQIKLSVIQQTNEELAESLQALAHHLDTPDASLSSTRQALTPISEKSTSLRRAIAAFSLQQ